MSKEFKLLNHFRKLNNSGKEESIKRVEELTEIPRYTQEGKEAFDNYMEFAKDKPQEYWEEFKKQLEIIDEQNKKDAELLKRPDKEE